MNTFPAKITTETVNEQFDFVSLLAVGETISTSTVTCDVFSGEDASPGDMIDGAATADGTIVSQAITGGVAGVIYLLNCSITTSDSQTLVMQGMLAVISTDPF